MTVKKQIKLKSIPAKGANPNVQLPYTPENGYVVESAPATVGSGCIASGDFQSNNVLVASVYNPTDVAREPYVTWTIRLVKSE